MAGTSIAAIDFGIIIVYVLMLLGVGYYIYRRETSFEEYLLASRSMTTPVLICTLASTYYGLDVLFGSSELAYNDGIVAFFGYSLLTLVVYLFAGGDHGQYFLQGPQDSSRGTLELRYGTD